MQMTTPTRLADGRWFGYGYGLGLADLAGHPMVVHSGGINGFTSHTANFPQDSLTVVVLCNTESPAVEGGQILGAIAHLALSVPLEIVRSLPISSKERDRVVGAYRGGGLEVAVSVENDTLTIRAPSLQQAYLYQGKDSFVAADDDKFRIFFTGSGARAQHLIGEVSGARLFDCIRKP